MSQTKDGMKMGKSLGNILEPRKLLDAYGSDAVRFYFLKEVVFGQACSFPLLGSLSISVTHTIGALACVLHRFA